MATSKLTLSVEQGFIDKAKRYASKHHTSVSKVFTDLMNQAFEKDIAIEEDTILIKLREHMKYQKILNH